ncbi:hypothetical protein Ciccas_003925 [Cichlidogyrus casuarinus]|uniref:Hypoxia up-regulated protein 1 n=1 Tax=Cichlidogyrus casuarinus TaxID=1844966 RepID=A0ABD2QD29_9PLAT
MTLLKWLIFICFVIINLLSSSGKIIFYNNNLTPDALGTMAIDLGNEFMKVAIVKSGVPMEIALNKESKRKTPAIISFRNNERFFGSPAESIAVKYPANAYHYIPSLIGKTANDASVKLFQERFPFYDLTYDEEHAQLVFKQNGKIVFTVEELMAVMLQNARDIAESHSEESIKSAVITVPAHFKQAERRAIMRAAKMVNLDIHQLINENTAVALHFGVFRSKSISNEAQSYMFYNMGSQSTSATIATYILSKEKGIERPQLTILASASDITLGISEFAMRLRQHLAEAFKKQTKLDVFKNDRAMMKLFKEAKKVVTILSANAETFAQVEYLMDEKDFKLKVTRKDLEAMCEDLYERVKAVFDKTTETAGIPLDDIKEIILMGGGTRVPKVQETLISASGKKDLGKSINSDEAAALGAVYQAAFHSPGFKVKQFNVVDFNYYPISVSYKSRVSADSDELQDKTVLLYNKGNAFPQKRGLSISKMSGDMDLYVSYSGDLKSQNLTQIRLFNVTQAIEASLKEQAVMKGFKVHFNIDFSGIFSVTSVEARLEKNGAETEPKSTLESIGDKISDFFGGDNKNGDEATETKNSEKAAENSDKDKNSTKTTDSENTNSTVAEKKPKMISVSIPFEFENVDASTPSDEVMKQSKKKLEDMRTLEMNLIQLEKSRNDLESYIFNTRDRIEENKFKEFSVESDRKAILGALDLASQWYEDQGADTSKEEYDKQLLSIKDLVNPVETRIKEHRERPDAFESLLKSINTASGFHKSLDSIVKEPFAEKIFPNLTKDFGVFPYDRYLTDINKIIEDQVNKAFTENELSMFSKTIKDHQDWLDTAKANLEKHPKHEDAKVKVSEIVDKNGRIVRETTTIVDKLDNNQRTIKIQVSKWISNKRKELEEENKKAENVTKVEEPTSSEGSKEETDATEDIPTTTPRSDL